MRCKNCGTENDDNRYICEVCGSPLYDEDEIINQEADAQGTDNAAASGVAPAPVNPNKKNDDDKMNDSTKKSIIVIIVLCVLLVAIIVGIIVAVASNKKDDGKTTSAISTVASTELTTTNNAYYTTEPTTQTTTKETTTKATTTKPTTTKKQTTTQSSYDVSIDISGNGSVYGDGTYRAGETAVLSAEADDGYVFDGWYENGIMVGADTTYQFDVTNSTTIVAKFIQAGATD